MTRRQRVPQRKAKPGFMDEIPAFGAKNLAQVRRYFGNSVSPGDAVASLIQGMQDRHGTMPNREKLPTEVKARWDQLIDIQGYLDGSFTHAEDADYDPFAIIDRLESEGFLTPFKAEKLRKQFNQAVADIVGHNLAPEQVAAIRKLLRDFDPAPTVGARLPAPHKG